MAIGTTAAILASAAIGAGATAIGSSNAANAANRAGDLSYQATQDSIASQERMYAQTRADNEWARQIGMGAGGALSSAFGLSSPSMTGSAFSTGGATGAPAIAGSADWNAYLQANPDVLAWAQAGGGDPNRPIGQQSLQERAAYHYGNTGQLEGRQVSMTQPQAAASNGGYTAPAGYSDPTAMGGYTTPERVQMAPLNISKEAFQADPGYEFALEQGNRALGNIASASRGLMSGQRMKAASRYNIGVADQQFDDWRNYTTNQYNVDRNFNEAQYQSDRGRLDQRYDQRNNTLLQLAGFGSAANAANQSAAQSFANNSANLSMTGAQAQGNAGINAANAWNQGLGNLMTTGAYLGGQIWGGRGSPSFTPTGPYA